MMMRSSRRHDAARPYGRKRSLMSRLSVLLCLALSGMLLLATMSGCASASDAATPTGASGGAINHLHDVLPLDGIAGTVLVATHLGLYRTSDGGQTWREVAGGPGQAMDSLMIFKLAQSPIDPKRIYALAALRTSTPPPAQPGIYTSADAGLTWRLAASYASLATSSVYTMGAGAGTAGTVYAYLPSLASNGLMMSADAGTRWQAKPALPLGDISGVAEDPGHPGRLFVWSPVSGLYQSSNQGATWTAVTSVQGGVYALSFAGKQVYVQSDSGLFVSDATGTRFQLVNDGATFSSVSFCAAAPAQGYGLIGTGVQRSADGGKTWQATAALDGHPTLVEADPNTPGTAYVGFSYPVSLAMTSDGGQHWKTVLTVP